MKYLFLLSLVLSLPVLAQRAGPKKRLRADILDRVEDRHDVREDKRDARHDGGALDKAEDVRDANEDKRERRREGRRQKR